MKKITATIILVAIILAMGLTAYGEVRVHTMPWSDDCDCAYDNLGREHYFVLMSADSEKFAAKVSEVSKDFYYRALADEKAAEEEYRNRWYVKAGKWCSQAAVDVADWVTFWN